MKPDTAKLRKLLEFAIGDRWVATPNSRVLGVGIVAQPSGNIIALGVPNEVTSEFITEAHNKMKELLDYIDELESAKSGKD